MTSTKFFLRDSLNRPFGVVYLSNEGSHVNMGTSMCHPRDEWNRKLGTTIALGRSSSEHGKKILPGETPTLSSLLGKTSRNLHEKMEEVFKSSLAKIRTPRQPR